jgi:type IV pilus assembly protein PilA
MIRNRKNSGFTLIELMIVVAILGILAVTAIPNFVRFQLKARAGEGKLNLVAIRSAEASYFGEYGSYIQMLPEPQTTGPGAAPPGAGKRAWAICPDPVTMADPGYCIVAYTPEGPTYYDYAVGTEVPNVAIGPGLENVDFFAVAHSDIDGDGSPSYFGIVVPAADGSTNAPTPIPGCVDVFDDLGNPGLRGMVGPCAPGFGTVIF